jgi:hypothetical protein
LPQIEISGVFLEVLKMKYKVNYIDAKGNSFSAFANQEKDIWEIYNMVCYGYQAVYMYDMNSDDLICFHEKPSFNKAIHEEPSYRNGYTVSRTV